MLRPFIVSVFTLALLVWGVVVLKSEDIRLPGNNKGYEPVQPLPFSHKLHAGKLTIACFLCHSGALRSRYAGVPPLEVCMNCHQFVTAPEADIEKEDEAAFTEDRDPRLIVAPGIHQLYRALGLSDERKPDPKQEAKGINWVRVHRLPDFVFFDHAAHVVAKVACETCHGPVKTMERIRQVADLSMGWCINCHRRENARGAREKRQVHAPLDCSACHH